MTNPPQTTLTLTVDEVMALLQSLGAATMNGLGDSPYKDLSEQQVVERINIGAQTLVNRGLVQLEGEDTVKIDSTVLALLGACVVPDATLLLAIAEPDGIQQPHYFNATKHTLVEHYSPRAGVIQFDYFPNTASMEQRLQALLARAYVHSTSDNVLKLNLSDETFAALLASARGGNAKGALAALDGLQADATTKRQLVDDIATATLFTGLVAWGLREAIPVGNDSVIVISAPKRNWLVSSNGSNVKLTLSQANGKECEQVFMRLTKPLSQVHAIE